MDKKTRGDTIALALSAAAIIFINIFNPIPVVTPIATAVVAFSIGYWLRGRQK
ncbi:hypothetical protein ACUIAJ_07535 [Dermabacteraceae bacterium CCM 9519]